MKEKIRQDFHPNIRFYCLYSQKSYKTYTKILAFEIENSLETTALGSITPIFTQLMNDS